MVALRRQQLSDIAVAYGLAVDPDATKERLLSVVNAAYEGGVFNKPPKDPFRLVKASKNPDEWVALRGAGHPLPAFEDPTGPDLSYNGLQQLCKANGIDSFQKNKETMLAALKEKGVL